ncbi:MAG: HD domain-containing protein [Anaerolineae bacterium]|nr:HD domain-containing protein [Anaerolineae bacterium]
MNFFSSPSLRQILEVVQANLASAESVYLVGGAVRSLLLQQEPHDFDFAIEGNVRSFARNVADALGGAFYMLDDERDTARIVYDFPKRPRTTIDFAVLRGQDIESDLKNRDFTINAMALDLLQPDHLIDPLGGAQDLKDCILRLCSSTSLTDDPARVLRAVRLAVELRLRITQDTLNAMRQAAAHLYRVSPERQRDELFRMLDSDRPQTALRLMDSVGIFPYFLPELEPLKGLKQPQPHVLDAWEHTLAALEEMNTLLSFLAGDYTEEADNLTIGLVVTRLGRYRAELGRLFKERLNPNRSRRSLLAFSILYHDAGKPATLSTDKDGKLHFYNHEALSAQLVGRRGARLALSQVELKYLTVVVRNHMRIHSLASSETDEISRRVRYRYFRSTGEEGIDIILLSLADTLATWRTTLRQEYWLRELEVCRALFDTWWCQREAVVQPPGLLNGYDIQRRFQLKAGPLIGEMLEVVREAQAAGELTQQEEAYELLDRWLKQRVGRSEDGSLN